jgi:TolB-like protein
MGRRHAVVYVVLFLLTSYMVFAAPIEERPFDGAATKVITGTAWSYTVKDFTIAKQLFTAAARPENSVYTGRNSTFYIRGWDHFTAYVGIVDQEMRSNGKATILVDEQVVFQQNYESGVKALPLDVVLTGHTTLTIKTEGDYLVFAEPKLVKGEPTPFPRELPTTIVRYTAAPFFVDFADLEKMAISLKNVVQANPTVKERLEKGTLALVPFTRVDIPIAAVSTNTAEDFTTALINIGFPLVERGRLERDLQLVKLPDSGTLDTATIQQLGKLTGCDFLLVGSLSDRGATIVINLRLVEVATGKALLANRVEVGKVMGKK